MALNEWLFDQDKYIRRMRSNMEAIVAQHKHSLIEAIHHPSTPEEERKKLADLLLDLKRTEDNQP